MGEGKAIKSSKTYWCSRWWVNLNAVKSQLIVFSVGFKTELIDLELIGEPNIQT